MSDSEKQLGREMPRVIMSIPEGYMQFDNWAELDEFQKSFRSFVQNTLGCTNEVRYDECTSTYAPDGPKPDPRTEPVMITRWLGKFHSELDVSTESQQIDTVGLKIIIRGRGKLQEVMRFFLEGCNALPDQGNSDDYNKYTFGCRQNARLVNGKVVIDGDS